MTSRLASPDAPPVEDVPVPPEPKRRRRWPVQGYVAVLVLVYVLAAGTAALYWRARAVHNARTAAAADAAAAATLAATELSQAVMNDRSMLSQFAASPLVGPRCNLRPFAADGQRVLLLSGTGAVTCASDGRTTTAPAFATAGWFAGALHKEAVVAPFTDPQTGVPSVAIATPLKTPGVLVDLVDLRKLGTALEQSLGGRRHLEFLVVDPTGRVAITRSPDPARWAGAALTGTPFDRTSDPARRPDVTGGQWVHADAVVKDPGWVVYAGAPLRATLTSANSLFVDQLEVILGGLVVFLVAAAVIAGRITRPIRRLSRAVEAAGAAGLSGDGREPPAGIDVGGPREIAALSDSFNRAAASVRSQFRARRVAEAAARSQADRLQVELERSQAAEQALREAQAEVGALNTELDKRVRDRTTELEAANHELEAFAYAVSHDLRAPLRAVHGFSIALEEDCPDAFDDTGREHLGRIQAAAVRMGELIDDLLQLSRVTRTPMARDRVDLSTLARAVTDQLEAAEPDRVVHTSIADDAMARGDGHLLRIVLENLLNNAWKFTRNRAEPTVEFGVATTADSVTVFYVADNGVGFDPRYASKLFKPFQRLHSADEFEGTGIGLATVARIVKRHGGRIWAESEPGAGARISFTCEPTTGAPE